MRSERHRIVKVGNDLQNHQVQSSIKFKPFFLGMGIPPFPGQPLPLPGHSFSEDIFRILKNINQKEQRHPGHQWVGTDVVWAGAPAAQDSPNMDLGTEALPASHGAAFWQNPFSLLHFMVVMPLCSLFLLLLLISSLSSSIPRAILLSFPTIPTNTNAR